MGIKEIEFIELEHKGGQHPSYQENCPTCWSENLRAKTETTQQKLREWILKQPYFHLDVKYDGMTAWELAGIILKEIK